MGKRRTAFFGGIVRSMSWWGISESMKIERVPSGLNWRIALLFVPAARQTVLAGAIELEGVGALGQAELRRRIGGSFQFDARPV